jgi:hypothetical protein
LHGLDYEELKKVHQNVSCVNDEKCFFANFSTRGGNINRLEYLGKFCSACKYGFAENENEEDEGEEIYRDVCPLCKKKMKKKPTFLRLCYFCGELKEGLESMYKCLQCASVSWKKRKEQKKEFFKVKRLTKHHVLSFGRVEPEMEKLLKEEASTLD